MSKITDIKHRILQMDGGEFQVLCDQYLRCRGYGTYYTPGQSPGTNKTTLGNPDTYFEPINNKYVFVMYTTQKDGFLSKAKEDILKCLNPDKTGVAPEYVSEIVYCHTQGRLSAGDHQTLIQFCEERNVQFTLIGLHELGDDLYYKYPHLAKEFFGISVDSGQIMSLDEYIRIHDSNTLSAPLGNEFQFRQDELKAAKNKLDNSDVLILTGSAGVGKTRLALKLCQDLSEERGYETLCIKSNGLELAEDLVSKLEPDKEHLVLIDDANELSSLHIVLSFLNKATFGLHSIQKIIITVRDYARERVIKQVFELHVPEIQQISVFRNDELKEIIKSAYGISNPIYLDRILDISQGNARLAMLASKVASESNCLDSIKDASGFYEHYYSKQIDLLANTDTTLASAAILAFFQTLRLDYIEPLGQVLSLANISPEEFKSDIRWLHTLEFADLCHDTAARISDQSMGNYLIKYVFIDKKILPLKGMIEACFVINRRQTVLSCNMLLNVFPSDTVVDFVESELCELWVHLETTKSEHFNTFLQAFGMVRPTKLLFILKKRIEDEPHLISDIGALKTEYSKDNISIMDETIQMLCYFVNHSQLPEAVDLLILYYTRRPDLFAQIYYALSEVMGIHHDSYQYQYFTQKTVVEKLSALIRSTPTIENKILFIRVAKQFLNLVFSHIEGSRNNNSFTHYTIPVSNDSVLLEFRRLLWNGLYLIYSDGFFHKEIEDIIFHYGDRKYNDDAIEVISQELEQIIRFIPMFSTNRLYHCIIAQHINDLSKKTNFNTGGILTPFLNSSKLIIYDTLRLNYGTLIAETHTERTSLHKQQIEKLASNFSIEDYKFLYEVCREYSEELDSKQQEWGISKGIEYAIMANADIADLFISAVQSYMEADTPYCARPKQILANLFQVMTPTAVKELLLKTDYSQQNTWLWEFYVELPPEKITADWANDMLQFLNNPNKEIQHATFRSLNELKKYENVNSEIILQASRIIASQYNDAPFVFHLYTRDIVSGSKEEVLDVVELYQDNIQLLEDIYLKAVSYSKHNDFEGQLLTKLIEKDSNFLCRYLDQAVSDMDKSLHNDDSWLERLLFIWGSENYMYYMDTIFRHWTNRTSHKIWQFDEALGRLLLTSKGDNTTHQKQELWIQHFIEQYSTDELMMRYLFSSISGHGGNRKQNAFRCFLEHNADYSLFNKLNIESRIESWSGSYIPILQKKIDFLTSLLPLLTGIDYLEHKQYIEELIESRKAQIHKEEIKELMQSLF